MVIADNKKKASQSHILIDMDTLFQTGFTLKNVTVKTFYLSRLKYLGSGTGVKSKAPFWSPMFWDLSKCTVKSDVTCTKRKVTEISMLWKPQTAS